MKSWTLAPDAEARFSGGDDIIVLTPGPGGAILGSQTGFQGMGGFNNPLDLAEDRSTGSLYVAEYGDQTTTAGAKLTLLRPIPGPCSGAPPPDFPELRLSKQAAGTARLTWNAVATATGYDLVRGSLDVLLSSGGDFTPAAEACLGNDLVTTNRDDPAAPAAGAGSWYLVRAVNCGNVGTYDSGAPRQQGSRDGEIGLAATVCP